MIHDLEIFLHCAASLEADAAAGYAQLARIMEERGEAELARMFNQFDEFSRMHLAEVRELQQQEFGRRFVPGGSDMVWPEEHSPENPLAVTDLENLTPRKAIENALETERRACDFYSAVAGQTRSDRVQELAQEFAEEEAEHVAHLQRWLERLGPQPAG